MLNSKFLFIFFIFKSIFWLEFLSGWYFYQKRKMVESVYPHFQVFADKQLRIDHGTLRKLVGRQIRVYIYLSV